MTNLFFIQIVSIFFSKLWKIVAPEHLNLCYRLKTVFVVKNRNENCLVSSESWPHHSRHHHRRPRLPSWVLPSEDRLLRRQGLQRILLRRHPRLWRLSWAANCDGDYDHHPPSTYGCFTKAANSHQHSAVDLLSLTLMLLIYYMTDYLYAACTAVLITMKLMHSNVVSGNV